MVSFPAASADRRTELACFGIGKSIGCYLRDRPTGGDGLLHPTHPTLKILEAKVTNEPVRNADFWRKWAEETRRAAEAMLPNAQRQMHLIAEHYEMLAKAARGGRAGRKEGPAGANCPRSSYLWWASESKTLECCAGS